MNTTSAQGMWSSRLAFTLAAAGSAIGLGNIWRFPYLTSDNGGGAFVLIYLGCIALIGLPIMAAEILMGRQGRMSPINTIAKLTREGGHSHFWQIIGWIGLVAAVFILSFYSVVGGWTLHYAWLYIAHLFGSPGITDAGATFGGMLADPKTLLLWHSVFMLITWAVVIFGVENGIEKANKIMMPSLFLILLILVGYGISTGRMGDAMGFMFKPDWSEVHGSTFLAALGQAFFSLSLGMCGLMTYAAYLPQNVSIPRAVVTIAGMDTSVAILAGLAIFPILFAFNIDPAGGGPGLIFTSLPLAFADMQFGTVYAIAFFILLLFAAWTSSISLLEPPTVYLIERAKVSRKMAATIATIVIWLFGLITVFSFNIWNQVRIGGRDLQGAIEFVASDLLLPIGGMLIALFAGWVLDKKISRGELNQLSDGTYRIWQWLVRIVSPILVFLVVVNLLLK